MIVAKFLHILGFIVWVGGMFFAYMALRPVAASQMEPVQRLPLWRGVFAKFFPWVWLAVGLILASGVYMMGQMGKPPLYVLAMFVIGIVMMLIFGHIFFAPYKRLQRTVDAQDLNAACMAKRNNRKLIGINKKQRKNTTAKRAQRQRGL